MIVSKLEGPSWRRRRTLATLRRRIPLALWKTSRRVRSVTSELGSTPFTGRPFYPLSCGFVRSRPCN